MCDKGKFDDPLHHAMEKALNNLGWSRTLSFKDERLFKISLILLFFIICIGFELENSAVRDYWEKHGIDDPFDRLDFIIENHSQILIRGPILEMAKMAEVQVSAENAQSRGLIHDCFHTIYCYYADNLISGDAHFQALKDHNPHPAFERIILTQQIEKIWKFESPL